MHLSHKPDSLSTPRFRNLVVVAVSLIVSIGRVFPADSAEKQVRPNIVFILADDLGINDLSCYGRKDQTTPRLDRLATEGMRLTTAYTACSVCSPTRASILTGKAPARLHITTFLPGRGDAPSQALLHPKIEMQLPAGESTLASRLRAAGYRTIALGKWHLGGKGSLPTDFGFETYHAGMANTTPSTNEGGKGEYDLTNEAVKFIDQHRDEPFFIYLAHNNPHVPLAARPELIEKYRNSFNPIYAAMVETLDDSVGRLLDKLHVLGLDDNTIVVFTSDNGGQHVFELPNTPATFNAPYRAGKGFPYEGGHRVPLIVRWPGKIKPGSTSDVPVITTDWTPTLLALAGVTTEPAAAPPDGVSFARLLTHGETLPPRPLFWHEPHYMNQGGKPAGAIREGDWKLVENYEDGNCELYNLHDDPGEATDLANKEPARIAELRGKLEKWRRDVGAQENAPNPDFNPLLAAKTYRDFDASRMTVDPAAPGTAAALAAKTADWHAAMNSVVSRPKAAAAEKTPGAGVIILHARDAKTHGEKIRYEPQPHKDTVGFWVQKDDWLEWEFDAPKAGHFDVELLQGCGKGSGGAEVAVSLAGQTLTHKVEETGHFQHFVPRTIGAVQLPQPGKYTLIVKATSKPGPAVMDLRRVTLRAAIPVDK